MRLSGVRALITGAAGSIGGALATAFAREGAALFLTGIEEQMPASVLLRLSEFDRGLRYSRADLSNPGEVHRVFREVEDFFSGRLDVLVSNAGMSIRAPFVDVPEADLRHQVEVNFVAPFLLAQKAARLMQASGSGSLIFIGSTGGSAAHPDASVYDAMKAGVEALTRCVAFELGGAGIRANTLVPGQIVNGKDVGGEPTPQRLAEWAAIPLGRPGSPEEVAEAAVFLASGAASYISGATLRVDGGRGARAPVTIAAQAPQNQSTRGQ